MDVLHDHLGKMGYLPKEAEALKLHAQVWGKDSVDHPHLHGAAGACGLASCLHTQQGACFPQYGSTVPFPLQSPALRVSMMYQNEQHPVEDPLRRELG